MGEYFITIAGEDGRGETVEPRTTAFAIPYSAEYIPRPQNLRLMRRMADSTGAQLLHVKDGSESLAELFQVAGDGHRPPRNLWYTLVLMALTLYFFDIVARKLPPAEQWLGRIGLRLPQRAHVARRQGSGADATMTAPGRTGESATAGGTPSAELYIARLRGRSFRGESNWSVRR
jgi:hypothetical protein